MKSIGARLTSWYAFSATTTLAVLFVAGFLLLENRLIHGLDLLNEAEFEQIRAHLGPDYRTLTPDVIDRRIRETTEYASVLFYIDIDTAEERNLFNSTNLKGHSIPDVPGKRHYNADVADLGGLRVGEFVLPPFDVTIATPRQQMQDVMRGYVLVCLALLAGMLLASVAIGFGLSRLVLRPVRLIRETANRIGSDNLGARIPVPEVRDEISDLAGLLNQMFDRIEAGFNQVRRFTADASHELKTPLSLVRLHAEKLLVDGGLAPAHQEAVLVQLEELGRLNQVIDGLLFLSRAEAQTMRLDLKVADPAPFMRSFPQDACALTEHHGRRLVHSHEGEGRVAFEEKWLRQVLLNLLTNAIKASPPEGLISLRSVVGDGVWRVSVEDQGPGLNAEQRERMFDRFVRFAQPGTEDAGSGLGLAICRSIVGLHRGQILAEPGIGGKGLRVTFEIPLAGPHEAPATPAAARTADGESVQMRQNDQGQGDGDRSADARGDLGEGHQLHTIGRG
ncbi:MAG TPA: ATP-binding protein [Nevskia sp.]|nr:ATP-binding protein [Nevskia sp.]